MNKKKRDRRTHFNGGLLQHVKSFIPNNNNKNKRSRKKATKFKVRAEQLFNAYTPQYYTIYYTPPPSEFQTPSLAIPSHAYTATSLHKSKAAPRISLLFLMLST